MEGAFIGDIVGSVYEWKDHKGKRFPLFAPGCRATDDSLMTLAVARAFQEAQQAGKLLEADTVLPLLAREMRRIGQKYPDAGFGGKFRYWLFHPEMGAYGSFGNGAAMRVSPAGWFASTLEEAQQLAVLSCQVTHNHPDSYRAAQAVAGAVFLARQHKDPRPDPHLSPPVLSPGFPAGGNPGQLSGGRHLQRLCAPGFGELPGSQRFRRCHPERCVPGRGYGYLGSHCRQHRRTLLRYPGTDPGRRQEVLSAGDDSGSEVK